MPVSITDRTAAGTTADKILALALPPALNALTIEHIPHDNYLTYWLNRCILLTCYI